MERGSRDRVIPKQGGGAEVATLPLGSATAGGEGAFRQQQCEAAGLVEGQRWCWAFRRRTSTGVEDNSRVNVFGEQQRSVVASAVG